VRENAGASPGPSEEAKRVRGAVIQAFYRLIDREDRGFASYGEYSDFMSRHRSQFAERAEAVEKKAREQEKRIRSCP
jgi:hypothetical protein